MPNSKNHLFSFLGCVFLAALNQACLIQDRYSETGNVPIALVVCTSNSIDATVSSNQVAFYDLTREEFNKILEEKKRTHKPVKIDIRLGEKGKLLFDIVWEEDPAQVQWKLLQDLTREEMHRVLTQLTASGNYYPVIVEVYSIQGKLHYTSVWEKSNRSFRMHNQLSPEEFRQKRKDYSEEFTLVHYDVVMVNYKPFYAAIWWQKEINPQNYLLSLFSKKPK